MNISEIKIKNLNYGLLKRNKAHWDTLIKPLNSMGDFEEIIARIGAIQEKEAPAVDKGIILVFAADNGIVNEGVTQSGQEITAICSEGIANMEHSVALMAKDADIQISVIDVGVNAVFDNPRILNRKIRMGSRNFAETEALTKEEAIKAIGIGIDFVSSYKAEGFNIIGVGEMGIGNTTTAAAMACALLNEKPARLTGRGAGLSDEGLKKKIEVIADAIERYNLREADALTVLRSVGGYDIAAMTGVFIGGAMYGVPIVIDGVISAVAALCAEELVSGTREYMIPSHLSKEPAMAIIMDKLGLKPVIDANLALGEGTGAVMMLRLLKMVNEVYLKCPGFTDKALQPYEKLS